MHGTMDSKSQFSNAMRRYVLYMYVVGKEEEESSEVLTFSPCDSLPSPAAEPEPAAESSCDEDESLSSASFFSRACTSFCVRSEPLSCFTHTTSFPPIFTPTMTWVPYLSMNLQEAQQQH